MIRDQLVKRALMHNDFKMIAQLTVDLDDEVFGLYSKAWSESAREAAAEARRGGKEGVGEGGSAPKGEAPAGSKVNEVSKEDMQKAKDSSWKGEWNSVKVDVTTDKIEYKDYDESKAEGQGLKFEKQADESWKLKEANSAFGFSDDKVDADDATTRSWTKDEALHAVYAEHADRAPYLKEHDKSLTTKEGDGSMIDQLVIRALLRGDYKMVAQLTAGIDDEVFALYSKAWSDSAREAAAEARRGAKGEKAGEGRTVSQRAESIARAGGGLRNVNDQAASAAGYVVKKADSDDPTYEAIMTDWRDSGDPVPAPGIVRYAGDKNNSKDIYRVTFGSGKNAEHSFYVQGSNEYYDKLGDAVAKAKK